MASLSITDVSDSGASETALSGWHVMKNEMSREWENCRYCCVAGFGYLRDVAFGNMSLEPERFRIYKGVMIFTRHYSSPSYDTSWQKDCIAWSIPSQFMLKATLPTKHAWILKIYQKNSLTYWQRTFELHYWIPKSQIKKSRSRMTFLYTASLNIIINLKLREFYY